MENEDIIWVKICKDFTGEERDIYIGTCYFNPSNGGDGHRVITKLVEDIITLKEKGEVMIIGDLNAKTGTLDDTITPDRFDEEFNLTFPNPPPKRNSQDTAVNARGKQFKLHHNLL